MKIEHTTVKQTMASINGGAHVCITSWGNGNGWDIELCDDGGDIRRMQVYEAEWDALIKTMREHRKEKP